MNFRDDCERMIEALPDDGITYNRDVLRYHGRFFDAWRVFSLVEDHIIEEDGERRIDWTAVWKDWEK
jgi:hypothetical protein